MRQIGEAVPAAVKAQESVLHDVFRAVLVARHDDRQPHQSKRMRLI